MNETGARRRDQAASSRIAAPVFGLRPKAATENARPHANFVGDRLKTRTSTRVRDHATHFFVIPGHEVPDVETVIESSARFNVAEKHVDEEVNRHRPTG